MLYSVKNKSYRQDIDGLRAIAVLSVILFHIDKSLIPGGFVGVDIFFVISGYLISMNIFRDLNGGCFSIVDFYKKRIKRIAPAMLFVVLVVVIISQFILRPSDAEKVAESGLWSLLSLANVYFWLFEDTSYFSAATSEKPLLHLWSLGVEEQFYIFWPLILLITHRMGHGKYFLLICGFVTVTSFILGEYLFSSHPSFVYYMLPTRAGELLIGALLAYFVIRRSDFKVSENSILVISILGVVLIFGSLFLLSEDNVFPGLRAVPPTFGTAMLIFAGHFGSSLPIRILKLKPMVWLGLISYSAYLWHWPILAFYRYGQAEVTLLSGVIIFCLTILLAWLSYIYIETPSRYSQGNTLKIFFKQFIFPSGMIAFIALFFMKIDGYGLRWVSEEYKSKLMALRDETLPAYHYDYVCQRQVIKQDDVDNEDCIVGNKSQEPPNAILWGDSNAAHYIGIVGAFAKKNDFRFRNLQIGSCPPIDSDASNFVNARRIADCRNSREITMYAIKAFQVVMISANWPSYQSKSDRFMDVFFETVQSLLDQGKQIILIGKAPIIPAYDRLCREKALSFPFVSCEVDATPLSNEVSEINEKLKDFAVHTKNVDYYDFNKYLCPHGNCTIYDEYGKVMYFDSSHLSLSASWDIGNKIISRYGGVPFPFNTISKYEGNIKSAHYSEVDK